MWFRIVIQVFLYNIKLNFAVFTFASGKFIKKKHIVLAYREEMVFYLKLEVTLINTMLSSLPTHLCLCLQFLFIVDNL